MRKVKLTVGTVEVRVRLLDTPTAEAVWKALPFSSWAALWGREVYFASPVRAEREDGARTVVEAGELAYRPEGGAIVVAWGVTPASEADEIRLAVPANVWGQALDDVRLLEGVRSGETVTLERLVD